MKNNDFQSSYGTKIIFIKASYVSNINVGEKVFSGCYFKVCEFFLFRHVKKLVYTLVCMNLFHIPRKESNKQILFMRSKFIFLFVGIQFDVPKCEFIVKKQQIKRLAVFLSIFVADPKIIFDCKFVAAHLKNQPFRAQKTKVGSCNIFKYFQNVNFLA